MTLRRRASRPQLKRDPLDSHEHQVGESSHMTPRHCAAVWRSGVTVLCIVALAPLGWVQRSTGPLALWGVRLRAPLDTKALQLGRCMSGAEFAHVGGTYSPIADAVIVGAPHQHRDSVAVLRALAPTRVCFARVPSGATVITTALSDTVVNAMFYWPDTGGRPSEDSISHVLTRLYGRPVVNEFGTPVWSRDSTGIYLADKGPYWEGTTISLSDQRACVRHERLVHRTEPLVGPPDSTTNQC